MMLHLVSITLHLQHILNKCWKCDNITWVVEISMTSYMIKKKKKLKIHLKFFNNKANFDLTVESNVSIFFQYVLVTQQLD